MVKFDFTKFDWSLVDKTTARKLMGSGIQFMPPTGPQWAVAQQVAQGSKALKQIAEEDPHCQIIGAQGLTFGRAGQPRPSVFTVAGGAAGGAADGIGVVGGGGVWRSSQPQWGWYVAGGLQAQTNISVGVGLQVTYIWGPPSDLAGPSINVGLDVGPNVIALSPRLIIALKNTAPHFDLVGLSLGLSVGLSVLPLNLTVELTGTAVGVF